METCGKTIWIKQMPSIGDPTRHSLHTLFLLKTSADFLRESEARQRIVQVIERRKTWLVFHIHIYCLKRHTNILRSNPPVQRHSNNMGSLSRHKWNATGKDRFLWESKKHLSFH